MRQKQPWVTYFLIAASGLVALTTNFGENALLDRVQWLFISWYQPPPLLTEVQAGQVWRLITPIFIHFGIMHLLFNSIMTIQLGVLLEKRLGHLRFTSIVLILALASNLTEYWLSGPAFGGLSGVLYGLLGYFGLASRLHSSFGFNLNNNAALFLGLWFVLGWFDFFGLFGNISIANGAHTSGLIMGLLLALVIKPPYRQPPTGIAM